jgi:2,3-bisphosphoglycerate-independent phosphoglycerate mutase
MNKVLLIVRDGWGFSAKTDGNAIYHADTPFDDSLLKSSSQVLLTCHGEDVGLPAGFQGSSEVGHMNMGAGRIVEQEVTRIFRAMKDRSIFQTPVFKKIEKELACPGVALHLFGLLQDEGVHAHQEHLFELFHYIRRREPELQIWIHPIADGRDTPPRSFRQFFERLESEISGDPRSDIGTVWGRYYGMDRGKNWTLIDVAYQAMVFAKGTRSKALIRSVEEAYGSDQTPDNVPMFDEYLKPLISNEYTGMNSGDVIINFNYRQDRAIQMTRAFMDSTCPSYTDFSRQVSYYGLTRYYDEFQKNIVMPIDGSGSMDNLLGEVISQNNLKQLRISETQKFRHITSFFNGKRTEPFPGEDRREVHSQYDPSSFASHPEMNAEDVTDELVKQLLKDYQFVLVNYANCDMVGHTGIFEAAKQGAEHVDANVQRVTDIALQNGYTVLITADHGNSEEMVDDKGLPKTSHTLNPVKLHLLSRERSYHFETDRGILSDIAVLVLKLLGLSTPKEMTSIHLAENIVQKEG